ncbi:steroidogenic acute regulatory protein, mitochondrial-like [Oscarella lobularis]|uniref:steroidogenic acute regulatory protein, mitochondrial-like n=1 Tax=Oscarella lobularis TaxID=121494 RepID=UPI0033140FE1
MAEKGEDPYTDADFERLLELEKEDAAKGNWTEAKRSPDANVWRKKDPNHDIHLLKGYLKCPGVPAADAVELVTNYELRQKWEKRFYVVKVLEEFPTYKTVYWAVKFPPPCSNRDVVQHIKIKVDGDATMILYKHTTHPAMPEQPGIVRSETIFSGTIIRPDPNDANSSTISILFQVDLKGWIPAFVINILAASTPLEWRGELVKYHRDVYSKQKSQNQTPE